MGNSLFVEPSGGMSDSIMIALIGGLSLITSSWLFGNAIRNGLAAHGTALQIGLENGLGALGATFLDKNQRGANPKPN